MSDLELHVGATWIETRVDPIIRRDFEVTADLPRVLQALLAEPELEAFADLAITLHPPLVQLRTLRDIPPVTGNDLEKIVADGVERFFRLPTKMASLSAAWITVDGERLVRAAGIRREILAGIDAAVLEQERRIKRCVVADPQNLAQLELLPDSTREVRERATRQHYAISSALLALGILLPVATYAGDLILDVRRVTVEQSALAGPLEQINSIEAALTDLRPIAAAFARQQTRDLQLSEWVSSVAETLPDLAYLRALHIESGGTLRLEIIAPDALEVLSVFEQAGFTKPRIEAPPIPENSGAQSLERFALLVERRP